MFKEEHDSIAVIWIFYRKPQFIEFEYCINLKIAKHSNYLGICSGALVMNWNVLLGCLVAKQMNSPVFIFSSVRTTWNTALLPKLLGSEQALHTEKCPDLPFAIVPRFISPFKIRYLPLFPWFLFINVFAFRCIWSISQKYKLANLLCCFCGLVMCSLGNANISSAHIWQQMFVPTKSVYH